MKEITKRSSSTEEIGRGMDESSRHGAGAGGEKQGGDGFESKSCVWGITLHTHDLEDKVKPARPVVPGGAR